MCVARSFPVKTRYPLEWPSGFEIIPLDDDDRFTWFWQRYMDVYRPMLAKDYFPLEFRSAAMCNLFRYKVPLYIAKDGRLINAEGNRRLALQRHYQIKTFGVIAEKDYWQSQIGILDFNHE